MKKSYLLLLMACCAVFGADIDISRAHYNRGQVQDLTTDGKKIVRLTVAPGKKEAYRRLALKVEPKKNYTLKFYFKGDDLKPLAGKSLKGAGVTFSRPGGSIIYRGGNLGLWKHSLGTFGWTKVEIPFKTTKETLLYLTLEIADATGSAEFSDISVTETAAVKKKAAPQLKAALFPVDYQKGVYYIARNMPAVWVFTLDGTRKPKAPVLELDLPEGVECIGASHLWPSDPGKKTWVYVHDKPVVKAITRNGRKYNKYTLKIGAPTVRNFKAWRNDYRVYLKSKNANGAAYWRLTDGNFKGEYKKVELKDAGNVVYPARAMKKFHLYVDYPMNFYGGMPEMAEAYNRYWHKLDVKPWTKLWHIAWAKLPQAQRDQHAKEYTIGVAMSTWGSTPRYNLASWLKKNNLPHNYRLMEPRSSREPDGVLCPEEIIEDKGGIIWNRFAVEGIRGYLNGFKPHFVEYDFEPGAMGHCFCEVCRAKFSQPVKTKKEILANHRKAWFEFRLKQHAEVARRFLNMVKKHFPGALAAMCTDPLHPGASPLAEWCGVDPRMFDADGVDIYQNMPYFEGVQYFDSMELNIRELKSAPHMPLIDPTEDMERYYIRYTPNGVKTVILACAANGGIGQGFYPSDHFDGRYLVSIAEGADLIAKAEDFYMSGKRLKNGTITHTVLNSARYNFTDNGNKITVESPDFRPTTRSTVHEYKGRLLYTLFNYHPRSAMIAKINVPKGMYAREINSNRALGKAATVKIPSGSVALIEFSKKPYKLPVMPSFESELANFKSAEPIGNYGMLRPGNAVLPKIAGAGLAAYVDPDSNGNIIGLQTGNGSDYLYHKDRGHLGDLIAYPAMAEKVVSYKITAPGCFEYQVPAPDDARPDADPYEGLIIRKRYSVEKNGKVLKAVFEVENASPRKTTMNLKLRVRNIPKAGGRLAGEKVLAEITRINGKKASAFAKPSDIPAGGISVSVADGSMKEELIIQTDKSFKKFFCWDNSANLYTVEPEVGVVTLPYKAKKVYTVKYLIGK